MLDQSLQSLVAVCALRGSVSIGHGLQVEAADPIELSVYLAAVALAQSYQVGCELHELLGIETQPAAGPLAIVEATPDARELVVGPANAREESTGSAQDRSAAF